ncbi:MAG: hypothetical protein QOJ03_268 [Frankiaceae bacterium]|nr:hypothetical protein [Frankiaceae bacterium]
MTQQTGYGGPIVTGEAVAVELRPAGVGSRGVALIIDFIVQFLLAVLLLWLIANLPSSLDVAGVEALGLVVFVAIVLGYPVGFETLWRGRTPGKAVMGLRVLRDDGGPVRFRHVFVRGLVGVVVDRPGLSFGLLALIPMLMTARSKRLGDLAAGTVVVQDRVPSRVAPPPEIPPQLAVWAGALDLSRVTDDLAGQIRQFLTRAPQLAPWKREEMGSRLFQEVVAVTASPPAEVPPGVYLATVLAERRRREIERLQGTQPVMAPPSAPAGPTPSSPPADPAPPATPGPFAPPT